MLILLEGLVMCLFLLLFCVIGTANGPVGLAVLYERDVQDRVVELGLTTRAKIRQSLLISFAALYLPYIFVVPAFVYGINGAVGFWAGFWQMTAIFLIQNVFDRIFVDWYWVGHTKAWEIPGTEDLKPYIPKKVLLGKWAATILVNPLIAAILAWAVTLIV